MNTITRAHVREQFSTDIAGAGKFAIDLDRESAPLQVAVAERRARLAWRQFLRRNSFELKVLAAYAGLIAVGAMLLVHVLGSQQ